MDWVIVVAFLVVSASLNGLMTVLKGYPEIANSKFFKKHKPAIPPLLGAIAGAVFAPFYVGLGVPMVILGFAVGFLAGTMSTSVYEIFEGVVKRKADSL